MKNQNISPKSIVTVVNIYSLSFTGTTWLNLLIGSHKNAFALGPPDRIFRLHEEEINWQDACRVHGKSCSFWPGFYKQCDLSQNLYLQLAQTTNKDFIIINNPIPGGPAHKQLQSPHIIIKNIYIVRDGRVVCASYCRHYPQSDFYDVVKDWFTPSAKNLPFAPDNPDTLSLRYEDVVANPQRAITQIGTFIGLEYSDQFYKFWEFEQHITAGNAGTIGLIRQFNNRGELSGPKKKKLQGNKKFYAMQFDKLCENPQQPFIDQRWQDEIGEREKFIFDYYCGEINEFWGYKRDRFYLTQVKTFLNELKIVDETLATLP